MSGKLISKLIYLALGFVAVIATKFLYTLYPFDTSPTSLTDTLKILNTLPPLEIGDIILREGRGIESAVIQRLSNHPYTHIGLIVSTQPIIILHATPDDNPTKPNQVILSSLDEFLSHAKQIAIKRFDFSAKTREKIALEAPLWLGEPFVLSGDTSSLYCTTLLESILSPHIALNLPYEYIDFSAFKGTYLFPKAFFEAPQSTLIYQSDSIHLPY